MYSLIDFVQEFGFQNLKIKTDLQILRTAVINWDGFGDEKLDFRVPKTSLIMGLRQV